MPSLSHKERKQRKSCVDWLNILPSLEDPQKRYKRGEAKLELVDFAEGGEGKLERQHRHMFKLPEKIWFGSENLA